MIPPAIPPDEAARIAALRRYGILDSMPEQVFDDFALLAAQICETPVSFVSFVDEDRQWFKAAHGSAERETPRSVSFCGHAILETDRVMVVRDALDDPRFKGNPLVEGAPYVRFYAGAPLVNREGHALGTLCVTDTAPRQMRAAQIRALEALSRQLVLQLELRLVLADSASLLEDLLYKRP